MARSWWKDEIAWIRFVWFWADLARLVRHDYIRTIQAELNRIDQFIGQVPTVV